MNELELLSAADARGLSYSASWLPAGCFPTPPHWPDWHVSTKRCR